MNILYIIIGMYRLDHAFINETLCTVLYHHEIVCKIEICIIIEVILQGSSTLENISCCRVFPCAPQTSDVTPTEHHVTRVSSEQGCLKLELTEDAWATAGQPEGGHTGGPSPLPRVVVQPGDLQAWHKKCHHRLRSSSR